jgi:large subunit ribosomal protein L25
MSLLHAKPRTQGPASHLKAIRKEGNVPIALINGKHEIVLIQASAKDTRVAIATASGAGQLKIKIEGEKTERQVMIKNIEQDILNHSILAVTFAEVGEDEIVRVDLEVIPVGVPADVASGAALLSQPTSSLKVKGKLKDLPEKIEVDISHLELGHALTAHDIKLPSGVELVSSSDSTVFSVQIPKEVSLEPEIPDVSAMDSASDDSATAE